MATIKPLPAKVAAQIKSSASITSLTSSILALVENALDAGAQNVNISLDFGRGWCSVEDDGNGIAPEDFEEQGGLGKPFREHSKL